MPRVYNETNEIKMACGEFGTAWLSRSVAQNTQLTIAPACTEADMDNKPEPGWSPYEKLPPYGLT